MYEKDSPLVNTEIFNLGYPILGICYGAQLIAHLLNGKVSKALTSEYGKTFVNVDNNSSLFKNVDKETQCYMSHTDYIEKAPENFIITANSK